MRCVACVGEKRNACRILMGYPKEGNCLVGVGIGEMIM
jgi:hypothetical protein